LRVRSPGGRFFLPNRFKVLSGLGLGPIHNADPRLGSFISAPFRERGFLYAPCHPEFLFRRWRALAARLAAVYIGKPARETLLRCAKDLLFAVDARRHRRI